MGEHAECEDCDRESPSVCEREAFDGRALCRVCANGRDDDEAAHGGEGRETTTVWRTEHASVYHRRKDCTHLEHADAEPEPHVKRAADRSGYKPCDRCQYGDVPAIDDAPGGAGE